MKKHINFTSHFKSGIFIFFIIISLSLRAQVSGTAVWPKDIQAGEYTITLYSPDHSSYLDNILKSNMAFAVKKEGNEPVFGMLWSSSILDVDRESRQASLASMKIDEVRLSNEVSETQKLQLENLINTEIPKWNIEFPLDDLINGLDEVSVIRSEFSNKAPKIIFTNEPTAIILIDGEPKLKAVDKNYELVENTGSFIIKSNKKNNFYLKGGEFWYESTTALGPWITIKKVPSKVRNIAKETESKGTANSNEDEEEYSGKAPNIVVVDEPTELVVFNGEPEFSPLQNTNLLFVENTDSDVFMNISSQNYFILISGRWFTTKDLKGTWNYVPSENLPVDFKNIGSESKKANVLSSIAGTAEAKTAVYDAQIPQTASVDRNTKANEVSYNGDPEFKNVEGLKLQYAVNTESAVFKDQNNYYYCDNAVWFSSNTPNGPWKVADERPTEIEKIPADNPKYNTKYVYIYETSPTVVYVGYTPGYYGSYVYGPTVIYGTGFYYNPWYRGFYYHHFYSYGFSMRYSPWYGWGFGFSFGSPYGWYGHSYWGRRYNHWGPPYYRPPYHRPPHQRPPHHGNKPKPSHPIYDKRPGINPSTRPSTRPSTQPSTRPVTQPITQPSTRPSTQPSTRPVTRPSTQPSTRPSTQPTTRPSTRPSTMPSTRPSTRPSTPSSRPAARPTSRPTARPSTMPSRSMRRN